MHEHSPRRRGRPPRAEPGAAVHVKMLPAVYDAAFKQAAREHVSVPSCCVGRSARAWRRRPANPVDSGDVRRLPRQVAPGAAAPRAPDLACDEGHPRRRGPGARPAGTGDGGGAEGGRP